MRKIRILKVNRTMTFSDDVIHRAEQKHDILTGEIWAVIMYDRDEKMISRSEDYFDINGDYLDSVTTKYTYDEEGRLILELDDYSKTTYKYWMDENGNSVKQTQRISYVDGDDYGDDSMEIVQKDDMGRTVWEHFVREGIEDVIITTEYDDSGQIKRRVYESETGTVTYEYEMPIAG